MKCFFIHTIFLSAFFIAAQTVSAANYDLKEMTPAVKQALAGRQNRYMELQRLKASGAIGENNRGYTEVKQSAGNAASVSNAENADRRTIYEAISTQNNLGLNGLSVVEQVFAEVQRDKARSGDLVQLPSGQWSRKP